MLIDYLLVSSTGVEIDLYHQSNAGNWLIVNYLNVARRLPP